MATWRSTLLRCLASSEAIIDFGEDEEISADVSLDVLKMAQQLRQHLQQHVTSSRWVETMCLFLSVLPAHCSGDLSQDAVASQQQNLHHEVSGGKCPGSQRHCGFLIDSLHCIHPGEES